MRNMSPTLPLPPPTSIRVLMLEKSYELAMRSVSRPCTSVIAASKVAAFSECLARKSKIGMPYSLSKAMRPVWTLSTGTLRGHEGNPLVVGNVMYVNTSFPNIVYALDLSKPGAPQIWKHVPNQSPDAIPIACCDLVNRGTAYHPSGKIFIQLLQGELLALDADGRPVDLPDRGVADVELEGRCVGALVHDPALGDDDPELVLDVDVLASTYLGDVSFSTLAATRRLDVVDPTALARADALFAVSEVPWSGTFF